MLKLENKKKDLGMKGHDQIFKGSMGKSFVMRRRKNFRLDGTVKFEHK